MKHRTNYYDGTSTKNLHFDDESKQTSKHVVFLLSSRNFLKEIENTFSVFVSSYRVWENAERTFTCISIKQLDYELKISVT